MAKEKRGLWQKVVTSHSSFLLGGIIFLTLLAVPVVAQVGGGFNLSWSSVDGGGSTTASGGNFSMGVTVGQHDAGIVSGGQYTWMGGFWGVTGSTLTPTNTPTGTFIPPTSTNTPTNTATNLPTNTYTPTSAVSNTPTNTVVPPTWTNTPTNTAIGEPTEVPAPVAEGPGDQQSPQISGSVAVWEDNGGGTWDVTAKNLSTGVTFSICCGRPADERNPAISGNLVVWQDSRNGNWDIYGARFVGNVAGPPFPIFVGPGDQVNPDVSGNTVVWQSGTPARWDIVATNVIVNQPFTLSTNATTNANPAIDGDTVVWQSMPSGGGLSDIVGYTLSSQTRFPITFGGINHTNPDISGNLVVWQEFVAPRWRIAGADLNLNTTFVLTEGPNSQTNPAIHAYSVVYQDSHDAAATGQGQSQVPLVHGRWSTFWRELTPGPVRRLSNDNRSDATNPAVSGSAIIWEQRRAQGPSASRLPEPESDSDIYGTICTSRFTDVPEGYTFLPYVQWMACRSYISGYQCGAPGEPCDGANNPYFRPGADVTRGQLAKIVSNAAGFDEQVSGQQFTDVPPNHTFYVWIERLSRHGAISGYRCGGPGEPCDERNSPYFRPGANATRGQISKIVAGAAGFEEPIPTGQQTFTDVPPEHPFYVWIEQLAGRGVIGGYNCGSPGEPCDGQNRAYFRAGNNTTRGQLTKIATIAFGGP